MKTFALQGDTLDAICVRYYGRTEGVVETVLAANPGLAELGAVLPHGTAVEFYMGGYCSSASEKIDHCPVYDMLCGSCCRLGE